MRSRYRHRIFEERAHLIVSAPSQTQARGHPHSINTCVEHHRRDQSTLKSLIETYTIRRLSVGDGVSSAAA